MKNNFKKVAAATLSLLLSAAMSITPAFAESPDAQYADGAYKGSIHFYKEGVTDFTSSNYSMCDALFVHEADLTLTADNLTVDAYVAYPVPAFKDMGKDGTLKDVSLSFNNEKYDATSDITTKAEKTFDTTNPMFGINKDDSLPTQKISFTLPREAISELTKGVDAVAFVNVFMNTNVNFKVKIDNITPVGGGSEQLPSEEKTHSMTVSAEVSAPVASYTVTIPESITMGTLSADKDNIFNYDVEITAENLGTGYIEVSAPEKGNLTSNDNTLAYTNTFKTEKVSSSKTLQGSFTVLGKDVKSASAGNYTGTAEFTIKYFAEK